MSSTLQFIARVKLDELRRQRGLLLDAYDQMLRQVGDDSPRDRLSRLYRGLVSVKCVGKALHPDLANLEMLLRKSSASPGATEFWRRRLEAEASTGRLRAEIAYLFGVLLGEWGPDIAARRQFHAERSAAERELLERATRPPQANDHLSVLDPVFAGIDASGRMAEQEKGESGGYWSPLAVAQDPCQSPELRKEARRFQDDGVLLKELTDALGVAARDQSAWEWPGDGVRPRVLWTRNKWRLYLQQTLPEIGILSLHAESWEHVLGRVYGDRSEWLLRKQRLEKLLDLNAPEVILANERRMLRDIESRVDFGWYEPHDPWDDLVPDIPEGVVNSVNGYRAAAQARLRVSRPGAYYGGAYGDASPLIRLIHAEVQTLRAAYPDRPLSVVQLDIKDFFPSIPHDVLLAMLGKMGLGAAELHFFERFLSVPLVVGTSVEPVRCGVPMNQHLSHLLADWLLRCLERFVHQRAKVRIVRMLDDVCLLAASPEEVVKAAAAIREFLRATGLELNMEKAGAVCLGGELPVGLPNGPPRWGLLELCEDASWRVHEPSFEAHWRQARDRIAAAPSLLTRVSLYNANLKFLVGKLALAMDLGDEHRRSVNEALRRYHLEFFSPAEGVADGLQRTIQERYLEGTALSGLPEAWLYWPVTAGGLGLRNPLVLIGQYDQALKVHREKQKPGPAPRPDWQRSPEWGLYYDSLGATLEPGAPRETAVMKTLVKDFIDRGAEISGGKQKDLSPYWRWILCLYGPEILERFGTFCFLLTELVPVQLIHEQLLHDSSLSSGD